MMSVLYFVDATTTFLWPFGDNKGFYSILFFPFFSLFLHCVSFLVTSSFRLPSCFSLFPFRRFYSPGCCVYDLLTLALCAYALSGVCLVVVALLCYGTEKLSFSQSAAFWKPCA